MNNPKWNETVLIETGKYYQTNDDKQVFLVTHQDISHVSFRIYFPADDTHSEEFTRSRHNMPCIHPYFTYKQKQILSIMSDNTHTYRMKITGADGDTNWLNVSPEKLNEIVKILSK